MKKYGNAIIFLIVAMLCVACSTGGEEYIDSYADPMSSGSTVSRENSYEGIWMVNEVKAEPAEVIVNVDSKGDKFGGSSGSASFYGFPFQAIVNQVLPGATISSIPNSISIPMRYVGYSDNAFYLEFTPMYYSSMDPQSIFFYVTLESGKEVGVSVHFVTEKSSAILNSGGETFSCIIPVDKIVCSEDTGVIKEISFKPEMELRYTSIKRTKGSIVGN